MLPMVDQNLDGQGRIGLWFDTNVSAAEITAHFWKLPGHTGLKDRYLDQADFNFIDFFGQREPRLPHGRETELDL